MTKKTYNTISDFLNDPSFKNWALNSQLSDVTFWDSWLENNFSKKDLVYEARDILLGINFKQEFVSEKKVDLEWNKLESKLKKIQTKKSNTFSKKNKRQFISYGIVASLLLIISVSVFGLYDFSKVIHKTSYGEILEIKLKDGTLVTLNSNSSLSYKKNAPRKVWLKGEAYFKVNKEETTNAKFWVTTNDLVVEVYGTQFNVKAVKQKTKVYLEEGNIWLTLNNGNSKKMFPGNYLEYSSINKKILVDKKVASNEKQTSWKSDKLIFINDTLEEVLSKVSDTYGVTFKYNNPKIKESLITGTIPTTNLDICLNAIKKSISINIKKENGILVVY